MDDETRPLLPTLADNPAMDWHLRNSLRTLADSAPDPGFRKMVNDVLEGRSNLRDIADSTTFTSVVTPLAMAAAEHAPTLTEEELQAEAERANAQLRSEYEAAQSAEAATTVAPDEVYEELDEGPSAPVDEEVYEEVEERDEPPSGFLERGW